MDMFVNAIVIGILVLWSIAGVVHYALLDEGQEIKRIKRNKTKYIILLIFDGPIVCIIGCIVFIVCVIFKNGRNIWRLVFSERYKNFMKWLQIDEKVS